MDEKPPLYVYKPKPMGPETALTLGDGALSVIRGATAFDVAYRDIVAVWLSYYPRGGFYAGFRTKIYARNGKTITLDDTTFTSFFAQERQALAYRAFVLDLIGRAKAHNSRVQIMGGRGFWVQSATILFGALFGVSLPVIALITIGKGHWGAGALFLAFAVGFALWTWGFVRRNRLRNLRDGVPDDLLPSVDDD